MAVLPSWYCVSLLTGCIVCAACNLALYLLAFALELWWIIESQVSLPLPAYILCALYLVDSLVAIFLAIGLAGKKTRVLLACLFIMAAFYIIEGALVLYIVITYWFQNTYESYGIVELVCWILRAIYGVFAFATVFSQFATWKDEKHVMMRLQHLSMSGGGGPNGIIVTDPTLMMKKDSQLASNGHIALPMDGGQTQHGYDNLAYTTTTSDLTLNGNIATISGNIGYSITDGRMKRSLSSASQLRLQRTSSLYGGSLPVSNDHDQLAARLHALNPATAMHHGAAGSTRSEFDASSFSSGIFAFPVRSQSELSLNYTDHSRHSSNKRHLRDAILGHKPRSLMYLDEDDYLARPPPSRPVSMGYVNANQREFSTQSLDRSRLLRKGAARRAASMEEVDVRESPPDVKLQKLAMQPFDYLNRPGSKPSDLDIDSEDVRGIRDVAL